jgi:16S rRNA G966 N2-methylase RsmD
MDLAKALKSLATSSIDIAFVDPPYERDDVYDTCLTLFAAASLLSPDGILILEHSKRKELPNEAGGLRKIRSLVQGDAALAFYTS